MSPLRSVTSWLLATGFVLGGIVSLLPEAREFFSQGEGGLSVTAEARVAASYVLSPDTWTTFRLPREQVGIKLVSNANVPVEYYESPNFASAYSIHYQVQPLYRGDPRTGYDAINPV